LLREEIKMKIFSFRRLSDNFQLLKGQSGQSLIEVIMVMALSAIILPALLTGLTASRQGKVQQSQRTQAVYLLNGTVDAVRSIREKDWAAFAVDGTFHPVISILGTDWTFATGSAVVNGFTQSVVIGDISRDTAGKIAMAGGTLDPSSKKVDITITWGLPYVSTVSASLYMTRYLSNNSFIQTLAADFNPGILNSTQVTNTAGGEVILINNNKAKWCSPALSSATIDLPDGPPIAVSAVANPTTTSVPNDVFVAIAPYTTTSGKLAYVAVSANTDPPVPTLRGTFTLDPTKYSTSSAFPVGINLNNSFKTNDVKYYKSPGGKLYALMATDLSDHEVIAVQINNGVSDTFQDPTNKIYKYWTFFNTRMYAIGTGLDTGFLNPSANAAETGGDNNGFESNPTRAYSANTSYAVDASSGSGNGVDCAGADKDKHKFYNYGFSLPTGTTIDGIEVNLTAKVDSVTGNPKMCVQLSWDGGVTWTTAKSTSTLTTGNTAYVLGGAADTWGRTWNGDTNFTNANFRVRVIDVASNTSRSFSLDWVGVKVHYSGGTLATDDQAPFGYGASYLTVLGDTGYIDSGGYLYAFNLSNIDTKTPTNGLDQIGCRILLGGYDCQPGNGTDKKYAAGETGASWSDQVSSAHLDCKEGGNIEINADHQLSPVQVGSNRYVYVAVGAQIDAELNIVDVSTPPTSNITNSSCGRGSDTGWKVTGTLDFDPYSGTEEAANSVYAKSDGTRAYMSSNGGILHSGIPDSDQFYILDTTDKSNPKFLSTWLSNGASPSPGHHANTASSGYYNGDATNIELYPRRALTVLNGERAVLVGQDGISNDGIEPKEYQVLNLATEATPTYCGGVNFLPGFNDLTSVSEADGDNFVYMIANTTEKQLKIIQGGPDSGIYADSGTFESSILDALVSSSFYHFSATINLPAGTDIKAQVGLGPPIGNTCLGTTFSYVGPNGVAGDYFTSSGGIISGTVPFGAYGPYQNPNRCFKIKFFLSTTDASQTPTLYDFNVIFSP
jgi:type II secretory pathway pseudopilin PulG